MGTSNESKFPREYRIPASQDHVRSFKVPWSEDISVMHAFVRVRDFPNGEIPDTINPRSHEDIKMESRIPDAIKSSIEENPERFHLMNRGCLVLAEKAWYDNQTRMLHFVIGSEDDHGMVDGATTDRVLAKLKEKTGIANFATAKPEELPESLKNSYLYVEIISGDLENGLRVSLADARNTSAQVKEFSLEDLGGGFDWLKGVLESSAIRGRIRYRENEPKPVDVRTVLALLTLFHPRWQDRETTKGEPIVAYTGKGRVIDLYQDKQWKNGYEQLAPVVVEILELYDYIHVNFQQQYMKAYGTGAKLGKRKEVRFIENAKRAKELPITRSITQYVLPDGWLYPLLAALRVLLYWPTKGRGGVRWYMNPFNFFDEYGHELVEDIVEQSQALGSNPNATGKNRMLWSGLRTKVENHLLKAKHGGLSA